MAENVKLAFNSNHLEDTLRLCQNCKSRVSYVGCFQKATSSYKILAVFQYIKTLIMFYNWIFVKLSETAPSSYLI